MMQSKREIQRVFQLILKESFLSMKDFSLAYCLSFVLHYLIDLNLLPSLDNDSSTALSSLNFMSDPVAS